MQFEHPNQRLMTRSIVLVKAFFLPVYSLLFVFSFSKQSVNIIPCASQNIATIILPAYCCIFGFFDGFQAMFSIHLTDHLIQKCSAGYIYLYLNHCCILMQIILFIMLKWRQKAFYIIDVLSFWSSWRIQTIKAFNIFCVHTVAFKISITDDSLEQMVDLEQSPCNA